MYGSETICKEERSRIRAVQMDNFRGLLGIRGMEKVPNTDRELCGVIKGVDGVENDRVVKRVYVVVCE